MIPFFFTGYLPHVFLLCFSPNAPPPENCVQFAPPFQRDPHFKRKGRIVFQAIHFFTAYAVFSSQFFWIFFLGVGERRLITLLAGGNPRFSSKNICIFHPKTLRSSTPFPIKKKNRLLLGPTCGTGPKISDFEKGDGSLIPRNLQQDPLNGPLNLCI